MSAAAADERFVSLTTFRRSGAGVATPVWIAPLADGRTGFWTSSWTGKVKRLARDDRITVRPCSRRGDVDPQAPTWTGTAVVVGSGPDHGAVRTAIRAKYRLEGRLALLLGPLLRLRGRAYADRSVLMTLD